MGGNHIFDSVLTPARYVPHSLPSYFFAIYKEIATKFQSHLLMYGHMCRLTAQRRETGREGKSHFHACSSLSISFFPSSLLCPFLSFFRSGGQPQWDGALIQCRTSCSLGHPGASLCYIHNIFGLSTEVSCLCSALLADRIPPKYGGKLITTCALSC